MNPTPTSSAPDPLDDPRVFAAVREYQAELEAGRCPDRDAFLARHPEVAHVLAGCLRALTFVQNALPGPGELRADTTLGDFRIVREVGRGGMGVVYEAVQVSLGRRVALKVLPATASLDDRHRQRFRNEALAAASLDHPHIVPVIAVGAEHDVHYLAMQFIEGTTLAAVVARLADLPGADLAETTPEACGSPAYFRWVARLGADAAGALEHAHQFGVVHRDVKPGNLLLDRKGQVWVADFGLAKVAGDATLTRTGDLVGTLRYMSPEQAAGNLAAVDHRADVYGLGATLYELLAGCPAFPGDNRQDVLRRIADEDPPPPGRWQSSVPADLETVVLKCLAKDPVQRYASAGELAADLQRFLEDRPVLARRPTVVQRLRQWARRHRTAVRAAAVAAVLGVALAFGVLLNRNAVIGREKDEASAQRERAVESTRDLLRALDRVYLRVAEAHLPRDPAYDQDDQVLLREALEVFEHYLEKNRDDPLFRRETALAQLRTGDLQRRLGRRREAAAAYERAAGLAEALADEFPDEPEYLLHLADATERHALLLWDDDRLAEARERANRSLGLFRRLADDFPNDPVYQGRLGYALSARSTFARQDRDLAEAIRLARLGIGHHEAALRLRPGQQAYRHALSLHWLHLGTLHDLRRERGDAAAACRKGMVLLEGLLGEAPRAYALRMSLAEAHKTLGNLARSRGGYRDAEGHWRQVIAVLEKASAHHANLPGLRRALADGHRQLGEVLIALRRPREAEKALGRALELTTALAREDPADRGRREMLGALHIALGQLHKSEDRLDEAERSFREAHTLWDRLHREQPDRAEERQWLANAQVGLGETLYGLGRAGAESLYRQGLSHLEALRAKQPEDPRLRSDLLVARTCLGLLLLESKPAEAQDLLRRAVALRARAGEPPDGEIFRALLADAHRGLGRTLDTPATWPQAEEALRQAIVLSVGVVEEAADVSLYRWSLAQSRIDLAMCLFKQNRLDDAEAEARRALAVSDRLAADYPDGPSYRQTAGTVLNNLAVILQRRQKVLQTLPLLEKAIDHARAALRLVPDNPQARRALVSQLANLAHSHFLLGDHDASARTAEQVSAEVPERHETHRLAAYYVARCGPVAAGDARLSADRRRELEQAYGDRAMRLLRKAVDKGYRDVRELSTGRAFRPLWDRADYQQLVAELKAKPK